jgi:hypothetical protein
MNEELLKDFTTLLENYWYVIRTRDCTIFKNEQDNNETYAKALMEKYHIV